MKIFEETTGINRHWKYTSWFLLVLSTVLSLTDRGLFIWGVIFAAIFVMITSLRFTVSIVDDQLAYQLWPLQRAAQTIPLSSIESFRVMSSHQIGVVGFKVKHTPRGDFYYLSGDVVHFELLNNRDLFIGTHRVDELTDILNKS